MSDEEKKDALEEKADRKLHAIFNGDYECVVCGKPSYGIVHRAIYCKKHYEVKVAEVKEQKP